MMLLIGPSCLEEFCVQWLKPNTDQRETNSPTRECVL